MRKKLILILLLLFVTATLLTACNGSNEPDGIKVTFELNGGTYRTSKLAVESYYTFGEGQKRLILPLGEQSKKDLERSGYNFVGWYTAVAEDGSVKESDKWDFDRDQIAQDGSTVLYAAWKKKVDYSYTLYYVDEVSGQPVLLGSYAVDEDEEFFDYDELSLRSGYTLLGFTDPDGNIRGNDGADGECPSEEKQNVDIYCKYIKGEFTIVSTADQFVSAFGFDNIYLTADIDLKNKELTLPANIVDVTVTGDTVHKVSNFVVKKGNSLGKLGKESLQEDISDPSEQSFYASVFATMDNCKFDNVTFENVSIAIDVASGFESYGIYVAPLCASATNCTFTKVSVSLSVVFGSTVVADNITSSDSGNLFVKSDSGTTVSGCTATLTQSNK